MVRQLTKSLGTIAVIALLIVAGFIALRNTQALRSNALNVESTHEFLLALNGLESSLIDAEIGQRGYIITGNSSYLQAYETANEQLDMLLEAIALKTRDDGDSGRTALKLLESIARKRQELSRVMAIQNSQGFEAAKEVIDADAGNAGMDEIRAARQAIRKFETNRLENLKKQFTRTFETAWYMGLFSTVAGVVLVAGVTRAVQRRRMTAERDAAIIRDERQRLQKAMDDRHVFERRSRQLDEHIRLFVDQIQDYAIFTMDTECRATSWNMGVAKVLGYEESEFIGRDVRPLIFTPEANASGATANEFATAAESGSASDDRWMMRKGDVRFWATGITTSIRDERDQLIGFSKVMRDMTMQKQSSDELSRLASELSEESRRKNEFLATLAHELRNPLSPIKNAVQLMSLMQLDGEVNDLRETMERQVEQLVRLIDDLMDVSRIGRGKLELKKEVLNLDTVINAAVEACMPLIQSNHQELVIQNPQSDLTLDGDPARLTQVLCNLLNNASKYSDANCKIMLSVASENGHVAIHVKDNGSGIAPDRLDSIFDMYSQLGDSVERGSAGLGIGLALVRTLVELHGGTVTANSEGEGKGSEFIVTIPSSSKALNNETTESTTASIASERFYRVLVVEDMRALAMVLTRLLSKLGHHVEMVENGEAALEKLKNFDAEVIFSDISMPMMTGYELARYLRSNESTSKLTLVAMTGYGQLSDREKAFAAGFDAHMTKPVDIHRLREFFNSLSKPDN